MPVYAEVDESYLDVEKSSKLPATVNISIAQKPGDGP